MGYEYDGQPPYTHPRRPIRCTCHECVKSYSIHNAKCKCECGNCADFREAGAPPAPVTVWDYRQNQLTSVYGHQLASVYGKYQGHAANSYSPEVMNARYGKQEKRQSMASLNMCERPGCNALIKGKAVGIVSVKLHSDYNDPLDDVAMELCPACITDIMTMLDSEPVTPRERAYDKPYTRTDPATDAAENLTTEQLAALLFQRTMKQAAIEGRTTVHDDEDPRAYAG